MASELLTGFPLLIQQFRALFKKNFLLSWRSKRATFPYLFSSLLFILLLFCIQKAIEARFSTATAFKDVLDPTASVISAPIPACEDKFFVKLPCFDFAWSGNDSEIISRIVKGIRDNNPGRPIPPDKVRSFKTKEEVDGWLLNNPMQCTGALHFQEINSSVISYGLQTNSTPLSKRGMFEDPTFKFQIPFQIAVEREISRHLIGYPSFSWDISFKEFAHPGMKMFSSLSTAGPTFFLAIAMFGFVFQINALVTEKELKLRQAMTMMGLYDTAYWLSWITWEGIITLLSSLLTVLFGMMFQFDLFLNNNFGVIFLLFFLFQLNMIGFAFFLSTFVSKTSTSTTLGYYIYIFGSVTQVVTAFGFPYSRDYQSYYRIIWSFFPPNPFAQGLKLLSDATATPRDPGISWSRRSKCAPNDIDCVITMDDIYKWLIGTFLLWLALAIYFDNIMPNTNGVRKSVFFFLQPSYWMGSGRNKVKEGGICSCSGSSSRLPPESTTPDDEDVLEEENMVKQQATEGLFDSNLAVQIRGLVKTYPGKKRPICFCCKSSPAYHALKGLWINFPKDQLFCLLGPNGAGKTTAINCLTGITPVTSGDALIHGHSIRSPKGMSSIRRIIGVCPQFDILWDSLSGGEHLHLFASIKGLSRPSIKSIVERSLEEVKLTEAARVRARSYSGGMKRRLSVAIALIGEPKLIILDEPTTGMDPISRRHVWDIIENAKKGRAVILTTHSMEEADVLSDRIGIMAKGKLRCLGTSIRLKSRFGTGFVAAISFSGAIRGPTTVTEAVTAPQIEAVKKFFKDHLDVVPNEESRSFLTFVIQHDKESLLTNFFAELQEREREFGITDIQLGLTTLEEVFLNIAKKAELEAAIFEERFASLTLDSGMSIQVPIGARFVGIPGTESSENPRGLMVEVYWEQDDTGELCISGHSLEAPIPPNIRQSATTASHSRRFGQSGRIFGFVIDLDGNSSRDS
ncbi:OLC1v1012659C1 [Oldenlandia corymbosa var. corymbosa]|uniref:OLC1v1012659C1 n=1 Tax=Oldenlandia corymbosa var. corymbosa TaxID=529605 RepID=A0AAV1DZF5_OLDCO|nr:OLC1v1012659C1 [Oldenlandia corymbosa var. corymbosa]